MRTNLLVPLAVSLLFLGNTYGQEKVDGPVSASRSLAPAPCAEAPGQTSNRHTHRFRQQGEKIVIPIRGEGVPESVADCEPVSLELHWANGRNNGSNFNVTFLDGNNTPIFARQITAFLTGVIQFPLSSFDTQPSYGSALIGIPTLVTIQAVPPFAAPANLSYSVTRVARQPAATSRTTRPETATGSVNEVLSINNTVRLIGGSQLPLVQIELKTSRPFPVSDLPLQLQIGKKVFVDELNGDHTGRRLTLSLTPEMFAELKDGDEIVAFFNKPGGRADKDSWHFGKLTKPSEQKK